MAAHPLLVLDFDGVVCDSLDECFVSSWVAFFTLYRNEAPPHVPVTLRRDFARLRPFIRAGADFMLIQEILHEGMTVTDQQSFDRLVREAGPEKMAGFKELFVTARTDLMERDRSFWMSLNRIYPHMLDAFARLPVDAPVHILSTKMPLFIAEILAHAQIQFPPHRIHEAQSNDKLTTVELLRAEGAFRKAIFVDDQIDYLRGNTTAVEAYLASWGYVKQEWLAADSGVHVITPTSFLTLIERELL